MHIKDLMHSINNIGGKMTNNNPLIPDVPYHRGPVYRPLPKPIKQDISYPQSSQSSTNIEDINPNINFDFEGVMSKNISEIRQMTFSRAKRIGVPYK